MNKSPKMSQFKLGTMTDFSAEFPATNYYFFKNLNTKKKFDMLPLSSQFQNPLLFSGILFDALFLDLEFGL